MANELHTMPLKIEKLMSSHRVRALELDEFGAYIKLLCDAWLNGGFLHKHCLRNAQALQRLCGCSSEQAERIQKYVIDEFFYETEGGKLVNDNLSEIYAGVAQQVQVKQDRAQKGARARWQSSSNAKAKPKQCQSKSNNKEKEKKEIEETCQKILAYLNKQGGRNFKAVTGELRARISNGELTEQQCYDIIDCKVKEWKGGDMEKHLNAQTLFRPGNYDKYREQSEQFYNKAPNSTGPETKEINGETHVWFNGKWVSKGFYDTLG